MLFSIFYTIQMRVLPFPKHFLSNIFGKNRQNHPFDVGNVINYPHERV